MPTEEPNAGSTSAADRHRLSALVDGEVDGADLDRGCASWRGDADSRTAWHAYHLIGDVMRSEQLGSTPRRDEAFLQALRGRLADEPVVLAPMPNPIPTPIAVTSGVAAGRRRAWFAPLVVAAGFATVAGVMVVSRTQPPTAAEPSIAAAAPAGSGALQRAVAGGSAVAPLQVDPLQVDPRQLVRDARLDRYFEAHRDAFAGNALGVPGGALRSVDTLLPQR